ncbi:unnamed protein product [Clonostachys chloroleuca]|uniref:Uncharacterized protein n=1 Tax=Clonostachys chloroleuca TaxID=1926264 RepID=A0AA35M4V9_9HYPO|nr:unnamed protein product [Clonostachys chloroleuca]
MLGYRVPVHWFGPGLPPYACSSPAMGFGGFRGSYVNATELQNEMLPVVLVMAPLRRFSGT